MIFVGILSWWYGGGWMMQVRSVGVRLNGIVDSFSIIILLKTLFSPYKQISAGSVRGPLGVKFRAWLDRLISRFVGLFMRTIIILIGLGYMALQALFGLVRIVIWPFLPLLPVIGIVLWLSGVSA